MCAQSKVGDDSVCKNNSKKHCSNLVLMERRWRRVMGKNDFAEPAHELNVSGDGDGCTAMGLRHEGAIFSHELNWSVA